jgi:hypothetical protein
MTDAHSTAAWDSHVCFLFVYAISVVVLLSLRGGSSVANKKGRQTAALLRVRLFVRIDADGAN